MLFDPTLLSTYPDEPGVYLMKNTEGKIVYVGKALSLRKRLKQYFAPNKDNRQTVPHLLACVHKIDVIIVSNEKEALLLENDLIKKHQPKFNILLKDDKYFVSLTIDLSTAWPRLRLVRYKMKPSDSALHFGPYPSAKAARETLELMSQLFPLRQCSDKEFQQRKRPCLLYDIKRCIAPCTNRCTKEEYKTFVEGAVQFLQGRNQNVLEKLEKAMKKASEELAFEQAAAYLQTIRQVEQITKSTPSILVFQAKELSLDILALCRQGDHAAVLCLSLREGSCRPPHTFFFENTLEQDMELLTSFILQHYAKEKTSPPNKILLPFSLEDASSLSSILQELHSIKVQFLLPKQKTQKEQLALAEKNAKAALSQHLEEKAAEESLLGSLQKELLLQRYPSRIECIDTSHLSGASSVAALVAFSQGKEDRKKDKLYHIRAKDVIPGDDYGALRHVLTRRLLKAKEEADFPDLLLLDGGKGQLRVAMEVLESLDIIHIDVRAMSKENARHDRGLSQECIHIPEQSSPLLLPLRSPLLFLLQKIRDRAHDRAIHFHRKTRSKKSFQTSLDNLPGIGPVKKKNLLKHFGSLQNILRGSQEELLKVKGLSQKDILTLTKHLFPTHDSQKEHF